MITIKQYAAKVGKVGREIRVGADPFHHAFIKATPEQQAQLRREWMLGHLEGQGVEGAERILSRGKGKGASKANVAAIDRAYSDFRYYVVRPTKAKVASSGKVDPVAKALEWVAQMTPAQKRRFLASI